MPIFLSITASDSEPHRRSTALRAALAAGLVLAAFAAAGGVLFRVRPPGPRRADYGCAP